MTDRINYKPTSFPIIMATLALMLLGVAMVPLLKVKLMPDRSLPSVSVYYSYGGANAVVVDSEVTTTLEGIFSRLEGLEKLSSRTGDGYGSIRLEIDKDADMDAVRFEVATLIRQVYPELPDGVGYPRLRVSRPDEEQRVEQLMSLTLNGPGQQRQVGRIAESVIKPRLSLIEGIHEVQVSGYTPMVWELVYDAGRLKQLGIEASAIRARITDYYRTAALGNVKEASGVSGIKYTIPVSFAGLSNDVPRWEDIRVEAGGRFFKLTDLVEVRKGEVEPSAYYRINGLSTISIRVLADRTANQLVLAGKVKETIETSRAQLPRGFDISVSYDKTVFIKEELQKIVLRVGLSLLLLLLFVWLVSRSRRYLGVVFLSMLANILIAFIFYHWLGIEIHIYSLVGITISLGIIIDNTIVMADHLRIGKGISVFRGVLAATLTTGGALVVVFFLDEQQQLQLVDFVYVILINLGVSLAISLFFIPALLDRFPLPRPAQNRSGKTKRRFARGYRFYGNSIARLYRFRVWILLVALLGFGIPTFLLPANLNGEKWYHEAYNATLGSESYNEHVRPLVDKALGGSLRLFLKEIQHRGLDQSAQRTMLTVSADMYEGTTMAKTNEIIKRVENFLARYAELEQFQTNIYGSGQSIMQIYFKPEHEFTGFPSTLKSNLESFVVDMGVGNWTITGVGRGFDNSLREGYRNSRVTFYGYNLEQLKAFAEKFKSYLLDIQRVEAKSIFINGRATNSGKVNHEHVLTLHRERLSRAGIHRGQLLHELRKLSGNEIPVMNLYHEGVQQPVVLRRETRDIPDYWAFYNRSLPVGRDKVARMNRFGQLKKERETDMINKENMEYTMVVEFDFIGSPGQKNYLVGKVKKKMADELPIGYRLQQQTFFGGNWNDNTEHDNRFPILLLILAIIYGICAVVFESLRQPFVVLGMIPLSFIGAFLSFYLFDVPFGQGGYAALLLLSGLTVNSALYIINDLNGIRKKMPGMLPINQFVHAIRQKIVPVMLTIFSTMLGLVPFLLSGKQELFWYSIALGTIGGLLFSVIVLMVILPLFLMKVSKHQTIYRV